MGVGTARKRAPLPTLQAEHQLTFSSFCKHRTTFGIGVSGKLVFQLVTPTSPR